MDFVGAKAALFCGDALLPILRDTHPGLAWAGMWDLPGGGRDGDESPETCLLREVAEELGLSLRPSRLTWHIELPSMTDPARPSHFFAGTLTQADLAAIRFGDEGQGWALMSTAKAPGCFSKLRLAALVSTLPNALVMRRL